MISGQVTDPSGAAVAGARIVATNVATNISVSTETAVDGRYVLAQLPLGGYTVTCEAAGFKKFAREGVSLNVGDRATINIVLEVGTQTDSVTVTADLAAVDTDRSVLSQLMDNKAVSELPLNGRQVFMLVQMAAGTIFTQQQFGASGFSGTRAWDTNGSITMHGGTTSSSQFNLDGASINAGTGEWKFAPLVDGIQEFKLSTPSTDASLGLSGGGVLNMTMKSGSNQFHGTASEYVRNNIFDAVATQTNQSSVRATQHQWNDFSGLVTGPIRRNKLFFSGWYEGFRERVPFPVTTTVPSELERAGDFSDTRNATGQLIVIYDPMSTVASGSGFARTAYAGNKVPDNLQSTISKNLMQFFPHSNVPGNNYTHVNNYVATPNIGKYGYNAWYSKFDYVWNSNQRTTASVSQNWGFEYRSSNGIQNSPAKSGNDPLRRINYGSTLDHVWTVNSTTVVDVRLAWQRYINYSAQEQADVFDGSSLGWKVPIGSSPVNRFPQLAYSGYLTMATGGYSANRIFWPDQAYTLSGSVSKTIAAHFVRAGTMIVDTRPNRYTSGWTYGNFAFDGGFTRRDPQVSDSTSGNSIASFLLGAVASGNTDVNASSAARFRTYSLYVQDDWKITPKLTVNLGLRWDLQTPITERYDRMVIGFDTSGKYNLGSGSATGGLLFAGPGRRTSWDASKTGFQPRLGVAWQIKPKLVMRASYGMSYLPLGGNGGLVTVRQNGYSRSTPYVSTSGGGANLYIPNLPGNSSWTNPYPNGVLQPYGNSLGLKTYVGQGVTFDDPNYEVPYVHQFNFGLEYELPWRTVLEASYVGSRTRRLTISQNVNAISLNDRLQCFANQSYCTKSVPNPFAGAAEMLGTSLYNPTISNSQAMLPYPQFTGVTEASRPIGEQNGDLLEVRANKRFSQGLMANLSYTFGKIIATQGFREPQYNFTYRTLAPYDRTHHMTLTLQYDLPFGRGKKWMSGAHGVVEQAFGGWQYNTSVEYMTGTPTARPDAYNVADPRLPQGQQTFGRWFNTCTQLANGTRANCASASEPVVWMQMINSYQLRSYDTYFPNIRNMWATQVNMSMFKNFRIGERFTFQFRAEAFNAFNTPIYQGPDTGLTSNNFGRTTIAQQNFPRSMQFAFRLSF
ncbi:MAG: TonB-dependent receptor [Acidobacteria bacterium]|nr:TonB-dependent receptor [Acidobacteriota bacterium]